MYKLQEEFEVAKWRRHDWTVS